MSVKSGRIFDGTTCDPPPSTPEDLERARLVLAGHALDADDLAYLLRALGL